MVGIILKSFFEMESRFINKLLCAIKQNIKRHISERIDKINLSLQEENMQASIKKCF